MNNFQSLREEALLANLEIPRQKLALYTWGNASAFDAGAGVFAIKPSGVAYDSLSADSMVVLDLEGAVVWGSLRPSSDAQTHRVLYRSFAGLGGVAHTHSTFAVAWAQAARCVPVLGTTHADHCPQEIPCTGFLSEEAAAGDYERETGSLIAEAFRARSLDPSRVQMALVAGHGPFAWGGSAAQAVYHAAVLEEVCKMAFLTLGLNPAAGELPAYITGKHWERKHGAGAYYGQR